jgi:hypothetical protein
MTTWSPKIFQSTSSKAYGCPLLNRTLFYFSTNHSFTLNSLPLTDIHQIHQRRSERKTWSWVLQSPGLRMTAGKHMQQFTQKPKPKTLTMKMVNAIFPKILISLWHSMQLIPKHHSYIKLQPQTSNVMCMLLLINHFPWSCWNHASNNTAVNTKVSNNQINVQKTFYHFFNPILFAICTSTFSKLCKNMYTVAWRRCLLVLLCI